MAKHSVQTLISVTRLRRGHLAWQHDPSVSTCQVSGSSSHMPTYSFARIFLISPASLPGPLERRVLSSPVLTRPPATQGGPTGPDQLRRRRKTWATIPLSLQEGQKKSVGSCRYKGRRARAYKRASEQTPALKQLLPPRGVAQGSGNPVP